jgi:hypothetical protein
VPGFSYAGRQNRGKPKQNTPWHKVDSDDLGSLVRYYCKAHNIVVKGKPAARVKMVLVQTLLQVHLNIEQKPLDTFLPRVLCYPIEDLVAQWRNICKTIDVSIPATFPKIKRGEAAIT